MRFIVLGISLCQFAFADFKIDLQKTNDIPLYAQQTNVWCGAGSGQMVLEGFPNDVNHVYPQRKIWEEIQKLKVENWYTDPDGLKNVLNLLGTGSNWEATCTRSLADFTKLVIDGLYLGKYPVPVVVYGHGHWVVVIGATTEEHPMHSPTLVLKEVEAHDPWKAQHVLVSGSAWIRKYWNEQGGTSGKWRNCFVGVHQVQKRVASPWRDVKVVKTPSPTDGQPISIEGVRESVKYALARVASGRPKFRELLKGQLEAPILVAHENGDYYLVPIRSSQTGLGIGAVMVNAYSGEWEGLSRFKSPIRYEIPREPGRWIFQPSQESRSPFHPVFRTSRGFLTTDGIFHRKLHSL